MLLLVAYRVEGLLWAAGDQFLRMLVAGSLFSAVRTGRDLRLAPNRGTTIRSVPRSDCVLISPATVSSR